MPYAELAELPEAVREHLPKHAQAIYKEAFNSAWEEYADPKKRRDDAPREEVAHRVAWAAVKQKYTKDSQGRWVERS
jgi:cation transport regulator